jgi:hypothetical protein
MDTIWIPSADWLISKSFKNSYLEYNYPQGLLGNDFGVHKKDRQTISKKSNYYQGSQCKDDTTNTNSTQEKIFVVHG